MVICYVLYHSSLFLIRMKTDKYNSILCMHNRTLKPSALFKIFLNQSLWRLTRSYCYFNLVSVTQICYKSLKPNGLILRKGQNHPREEPPSRLTLMVFMETCTNSSEAGSRRSITVVSNAGKYLNCHGMGKSFFMFMYTGLWWYFMESESNIFFPNLI